MKERKGHEPAD
jgi:hypothetical protein